MIKVSDLGYLGYPKLL